MDETRQRLLDTAGEVFAEKGFQAATVRQICGMAGVNIAAINYHFGDKERLYIEAVKHAHCVQNAPDEHAWPPGTPPRRNRNLFKRPDEWTGLRRDPHVHEPDGTLGSERGGAGR